MISRLGGAAFRAILVVIMIVTPAMLLPGTSANVAQIVMLVAIFAAVLTFFEYSSSYPGLVEFRESRGWITEGRAFGRGPRQARLATHPEQTVVGCFSRGEEPCMDFVGVFSSVS